MVRRRAPKARRIKNNMLLFAAGVIICEAVFLSEIKITYKAPTFAQDRCGGFR